MFIGKKAKDVLGIQYQTLEDTVTETAKALEKKFGFASA